MMKNWNELTATGKFKRLKKAANSFEGNSSNCLDKFYEELHDYTDNKSADSLESAKNEMEKANKYRGYTNYCPLPEIEKLLY